MFCVKVGDRSCPWTWTYECWTVIGPRVLARDLPCDVYLRSSQAEKMVRREKTWKCWLMPAETCDYRLDQNRFLSNFHTPAEVQQVACPSLLPPTTTMSDSDLETISNSDLDPVYNLRMRYSRFRILVIGRANAGKTTLLQKVCNTTEDPCIYDENDQNLASIHRAEDEFSF